jgi:hypothetical protein
MSRNTSLGMGYLQSAMNRSHATVGAGNIISRLTSQAITGHSLPPQVHQHYQFEFHIVLQDNSSIRRDCRDESAARQICTQLESSQLEGLHSCVFDESRVFSMSDKVEPCLRADPVSSWIYTEHDISCTCGDCSRIRWLRKGAQIFMMQRSVCCCRGYRVQMFD